MKKNIFYLLLISIFHFTFSICHAAIWQVGPSHTYTMPSQVSALVQNGDTVDIDAGTYTADVAHWTANNLLLRGVGIGYTHLNANNTSYGRKAIWDIGGNNTTVENIEFSNCHDVAGLDMNWAGIRQDGINLTVQHCYFHDNDDGILESNVATSNIIIKYTEFNHNGYGDGYSHNLYIGHCASLTFSYNYTHMAHIGHELKSRAAINYILYNRLSNETGDASYELSMPNGGFAVVMGNVIEQGPNSQNSVIVDYGSEGTTNPGPLEFYFVNNTVVNDHTTGTFVNAAAGTSLLKAYNNIFVGPGTKLTGTPTTVDTLKNWRVITVASAGFVNAANYDYHLTAGSQAINAGINAGNTSNAFSLTPVLEYSHPANDTTRNNTGAIDIGAYEFTAATGVNTAADLKSEFQYWVAEENLIIATSIPVMIMNIYDSFGRKIITEKIHSGISHVDISNLSRGVYFFEASAGQGSVSGKFFR